MIVLKATKKQYNKLNGFQFENSVLRFEQNENNDYIVSYAVLEDDNFLEIRQQLLELKQIEFIEPIIKEINNG
jgi:hypothetical protein